MSERKHPALNHFRYHDTFSVVAHSLQQEVFYVFSCHGEKQSGRAQFKCHAYDSVSLKYPADVQPDTLATDGHGSNRCCASAPTLDLLVHVMDWAHKPSELAELRLMLSTRKQTNDGALIGDRVFHQLTAEEVQRFADCRKVVAQRLVEDTERLREQVDQVVASATDTVVDAARFGLARKLSDAPGIASVLQAIEASR